MNFSEKASILGDFRRLLQDFLAPEMGELKAKLQALSDGQKVILDGQQTMEARLLKEIQKSEEKILLMLKVSELSSNLEQVLRENQQLKREKTQ